MVSRLFLILQSIMTKSNWCMDKDTVEFATYCIGNLSRRLELNARDVYERLKTSGILNGYIVPSYDVLHTFGKEYLMEDLIDYMREKGVLN